MQGSILIVPEAKLEIQIDQDVKGQTMDENNY
jgi:hypothetical protein